MAKEIQDLPQNIRVAGYIHAMSELDVLLAHLRLNGRLDSDWTVEEQTQYEKLMENTEPWWYALSSEEKDFVLPIMIRTAILANGEDIHGFMETTR